MCWLPNSLRLLFQMRLAELWIEWRKPGFNDGCFFLGMGNVLNLVTFKVDQFNSVER